MDFGFAFLSTVDIHKDVAFAEKKVRKKKVCAAES
jgi:hypothetical protein